MPSLLLEQAQLHLAEHLRREAQWLDELARRRREIAERARLDLAALRAKLAI